MPDSDLCGFNSIIIIIFLFRGKVLVEVVAELVSASPCDSHVGLLGFSSTHCFFGLSQGFSGLFLLLDLLLLEE